MVHQSPTSFYEELVGLGGGLMKGKFMLQGWKNMHPEQHYMQDHIDLYEHIDDAAYLAKQETFERWYENPIDLPGPLVPAGDPAAVQGKPAGQGRVCGAGPQARSCATSPARSTCWRARATTSPPPEQVLNAAKLLGTPADHIQQKTIPGGHIGLFMGARTLKEHWPPIARWIAAQSTGAQASP